MSQTPAPEPERPEQPEKLDATAVTVIATLVATSFVMLLNETALSVALPVIMADFEVAAATAQWLLTAVMLTMAVMMPTTGWILDRFSTRTVYLSAAVFFLLGSVACALAPGFGALLGGRILQAVGTAMVLPLQMTVVMTIVPPARRGTVMGAISVVMAVGPALGPTFAGAVMSFSTWHTTFWIMACLVVVAGLFAAWRMTNVGETRIAPLDAVSVVLSAFAFGGLVYALSSIGAIVRGTDAAPIAVAMAVVGVIGLALFVWRQLAMGERALLSLRPLTVRNFVLCTVVLLFFQAAMLGVANLLPLYLQGALLTTALLAGLATLPGGLVETVLSPVSGVMFDRFGPRPLIGPGVAVGAVALFWLSTVDYETPYGLILAIYALFAVSMAMTLTPLITTALSSLPSEIYSHGSAIFNTVMQLAGAAGTAVSIAVYEVVAESRGGDPAAVGAGAGWAFLVNAVLLAVAVVFAAFIRRPEEGAGAAKVTTITEEPAA